MMRFLLSMALAILLLVAMTVALMTGPVSAQTKPDAALLKADDHCASCVSVDRSSSDAACAIRAVGSALQKGLGFVDIMQARRPAFERLEDGSILSALRPPYAWRRYLARIHHRGSN